MEDLLFATNNGNKLMEAANMLPRHYRLVSLSQVGIKEEIPENGATLKDNALEKARFVFEKTGKDCFSDDTGLIVNSLQGAPGVYSARYAGPQRDATANMDMLLSKLQGHSDRTAKFVTVIALILNGQEYLFEGSVGGIILQEKRGDSGFGYDPVFLPNGYERTFAEMSLEEKKIISHRGRALQKLSEFLSSQTDR